MQANPTAATSGSFLDWFKGTVQTVGDAAVQDWLAEEFPKQAPLPDDVYNDPTTTVSVEDMHAASTTRLLLVGGAAVLTTLLIVSIAQR